jgi:hypothetical protein
MRSTRRFLQVLQSAGFGLAPIRKIYHIRTGPTGGQGEQSEQSEQHHRRVNMPQYTMHPAPRANPDAALMGAWIIRDESGKIIKRFDSDGRDRCEAWINERTHREPVTILPGQVLPNGGVVIKVEWNGTAPDAVDGYVLAVLPHNAVTPWATWYFSTERGDVRCFHGDYFYSDEWDVAKVSMDVRIKKFDGRRCPHCQHFKGHSKKCSTHGDRSNSYPNGWV